MDVGEWECRNEDWGIYQSKPRIESSKLLVSGAGDLVSCGRSWQVCDKGR